jgi:polar amino acid transport system ATP-binding protein
LQVMKQLARDGMTMMVVTHEMGFAAQVANKVVFIDQGKIAVQGSPQQVFHDATQPRLRQFLQNYFDRNAFWTRSNDTEQA